MDVLIVVGKSSAKNAVRSMSESITRQLEQKKLTYRVSYVEDYSSTIPSVHRQVLQFSPQAIVCVGYTLCFQVTQEAHLNIPLISAIPDIPGTADSVYNNAIQKLEQVAAASDALIVADEISRSLVEYMVPGLSGRVRLANDVHSIRSLIRETRTSQSIHRILVSSHDFRFISDTIFMLKRIPGVEVRQQHWKLSEKNPPHSHIDQENMRWADTIVCEWAGRNAVWYSQHKLPTQRLLVRLHGFESRSEWIGELDISQVEKVLTVSEFYRESIIQDLGWDPSKVDVIANSINYHSFRREKTSDAKFHLGLLGYVPILKRPHLAVEILHQLLENDPRFILHLRGEYPWKKNWVWQNTPYEADAYRQLFKRVGEDPLLRERVIFESSGANIESWFTKIGWVLSLSERETFHLAAAEGMASGAIPLFLKRTGVTEIFGNRWVFDTPEDIVAYISHIVLSDHWQEHSDLASSYATRFDCVHSHHLWRKVLLGE
ncbi:hypothetical protein ACN08X_05950 [Rothia sp. P6271]|uniref:hypothetical protein n=1 Tax=unclassified Rothia (in: high G+C Gram-positive bacteria) TaxID=2689056 RepID=UPI003AC9A2A5